jgi:hypothetical protein
MARSMRFVLALVALRLLAPTDAVAAEEPVDPRALAPLLRAQDFAALEGRLAELEATGARTREGWLAAPGSLYALGVASADDPALAVSLEAWRRASPRLWAVEMVSGWRQLSLFHPQRAADESLEDVELWGQPHPDLRAAARAAFERAQTLAPRSPEPGAALLGVAILDGTPPEQLVPMLQQPCSVDTACETARVLMLTGLEPHRGGSAELLLAFARAGARDHPENPNLGLLVAFAHRKAAIASGDPTKYFHDPRVFDEVDRAYGNYFAVHPNALNHYNEYARAACWAGRQDAARRAFEKIGASFSSNAWKDDFHEFAQRRKWAMHASRTADLARVAP